MASKNEKDRVKQIQEKCQTILTQLLKDEDNKYCVDCDAKGPRWASWNLGIFLCIRCAGIHRNLGVHISKVKSVNLDSWTPEQVVSLQQMGNSRARAVYEANLPDSFRRPQTDSALEAFVRAKYEHRKYVAREWVPPSPPTVNWDKEIDEEMERQKKKKRSSGSATSNLSSTPLPGLDKKSSKSEVVPQLLPKPKSSASPKPGRATPKRDSGNTTDLLGNSKLPSADIISSNSLNNSDDVFSSFLSAPQQPPATQEVKATESKAIDLKSEEESFFNQPAPSEKEKSKMTKDSILALYGQAPNPVSNGAFSQQVGGGFPQTQQFNQFSQQQPQNNAFPGFATQGFQTAFPQNGNTNNSFTSSPFGQFGNNTASVPPPQNNQFAQFNQQPAFSMQNNVFQSGNMSAFAANTNAQFSAQPTPFQNSNLNGAFASSGAQSFFGTQTSNTLPQQFGSMSLGHQTSQPGVFNPNQGSSLPGAFPVKAQQSNMAANSVWQ